jgi:hypothetical protein
MLRLRLLQPPALARQQFGGALDAAHVERPWQRPQVSQDLWVALLQRLQCQGGSTNVCVCA